MSLQSALASAEQRYTALATSTAEAQARLGREVAESRSEFRDGLELLETDAKQVTAT